MGVRLVVNGRLYDKNISGGVSEHNLLEGRDLPDCHPIEAITGLADIIDNINESIEDIYYQISLLPNPKYFEDTNTVDLTHDKDTRTLTADVIISSQPFEDDVYYDTKSKKMYRIVWNSVPWSTAEQYCVNNGGHLACPKTMEEMQYIQTIISKRYTGTVGLWLGGNDNAQEGVWRWVDDNSIISYNNWAAGEPNNTGATPENCMEIYIGNNQNGKWNDLNNNSISNVTGFIMHDIAAETKKKQEDTDYVPKYPNAIHALDDGIYAPDYGELFDFVASEYNDTTSIDLTYDNENHALTADVNISAQVDAQSHPNAAIIKSDGIYVPNLMSDILEIPNQYQDSVTVDFTTDIPNRMVTADVKIVNSAENALEIRKSGLFVDKYFDLDIEDTDSIHLYFEGKGETLREMYEGGKVFSHTSSSWSNNCSPSETSAWYFDDARDSFVQPLNTNYFNGFVSTIRYRTYTHKCIIRSGNGDDDINGVIIAYVTDDNGRPHTLSVLVDRGGWGLPYGLAYDYCLPDGYILATRGNTGLGSATLPKQSSGYTGHFITIEVEKQGTIVSCAVSNWDSTEINQATTIVIDLNDYSWGNLFAGKVQYGYCNWSQADSYFTDIEFKGKGPLKASLIVSPDEGNGIEIRYNGVYCGGGSGGGISAVSEKEGNIITVEEDGIYAEIPISEKEGNIVSLEEDGIYATATSVFAEDKEDNLTSVREDGDDRYVYTGISEDKFNAVEKGSDNKVFVDKLPVLKLRHDVNKLYRARMYEHEDLDFYHANGDDHEQIIELNTEGINILDYLKHNVQTNMQEEPGYVILNKMNRYSIRVCVSIDYYDETFMNDVYFKLVDSEGNTYGSVGYTSPDYTDSYIEAIIDRKVDTKLSLVAFTDEIPTNETESPETSENTETEETETPVRNSIRLHPNFSWITIHEISHAVVIDPVTQLNDENGIEDTPVGHMMIITGNTCPRHYLPCDGTEYKILDYPVLANYIHDQFGRFNYFGGDGIDYFCVPDYRGLFLTAAYFPYTNQPVANSLMYVIKYEKTFFMNITKSGRHQRAIWDGEAGTSGAEVVQSHIHLDFPLSNYDIIGIEFKYSDGEKEVFQYTEININTFKTLFAPHADDAPAAVISLCWGYSYINDFSNITRDSTMDMLVVDHKNSFITKIIGIEYIKVDDDGNVLIPEPVPEDYFVNDEDIQKLIVETVDELNYDGNILDEENTEDSNLP